MSETRETPARHQDDDPQASSGESAFVDTPVRQATRRAFDYPSLANLEALIAAVDARHAEEIAIKDEKLAAYKQAMEGSYYEAWQAERLENTTPREQLVAAQRGQREAFKAGFLAVCTKKGDAASPQQPVGLVCPFCGDDDFDAVGLKLHLTTYCEAYASVEVCNRVY